MVQPGLSVIPLCHREPHLGTLRFVVVQQTSSQVVMGAYWSSYAGSTDIAALAAKNQDEAKEYDYIICGGESRVSRRAKMWVTDSQ